MDDLRRVFNKQYGFADPTHMVTAPGRINLIGEHIDYNGLAVFPMALDRRISMAIRASSEKVIKVYNFDERYEPIEFTMSSSIAPYAEGEWGNYVKAAAQGLFEVIPDLIGFDAVLRSDIPVAAGLSSSSALVVATALALVESNGIALARSEFLELLADSERYVGTRGGGMDQAICVAAKEGHASKIGFNPITLKTTYVPDEWRFVVANSLVEAKKSGAAKEAYNQRTRQCRDALVMVVGELGMIDEVDSYPKLLATVQVEQILTAAQTALHGTLDKRFMHVVSEAVRVLRAERAMRDCDTETFGRLMSESHRSLRENFEVSGPELDELVEIATDAGAEGARLTGAGFGGCAIALCTTQTVDEVLTALKERFYSTRDLAVDLSDALFLARPGGGARVREF
jgi:galactokinase